MAGTKQARQELQGAVDAALRRGSTVDEVLRFLDARHIEHSGLLDRDRTVRGILRNTGGSSPVKGSVALTFQFDAASRLQDWTVKDVYTGP